MAALVTPTGTAPAQNVGGGRPPVAKTEAVRHELPAQLRADRIGAKPSHKKKRKQKSTLSKVVDWCLIIVAVGSLCVAGFFYFKNFQEESAYSGLSDLAHLSGNGLSGNGAEGPVGAAAAGGEAPAENGGINWDELRAINDRTAAWETIENTPIDYAVVQAWESEPDYFLHHDFWWNPSWVGVPFIDYRTHANARYVLTYAHHLGDTDMMYTPLYKCYNQWRLDEIGNMSWSTPEEGTKVLTPMFSLIMDQYSQEPQTFSWKFENMPDGAADGASGFSKEHLSQLVGLCDQSLTDSVTADVASSITKALDKAKTVLMVEKPSQKELDKAYINLYKPMEEANFHRWLMNWGNMATAQRAGWQDIAKKATKVVACVTCARSFTGLPDRTITVFAM